eukprot:TRINITY_DN1820_c0_g1_i1.p1 TRINITY_DN1820_c0_g1~~TRINITY_DN1820_c0_g1_i1.p1  ORF type:complete len:527 (+),score=96.67 TRINITY_DN1820_c0_g1_i1:397-1977(+)
MKLSCKIRLRCLLVELLLLSSCFGLERKHKVDGPIQTIVVLVMENRSFDHILGWLKGINEDIDGVTGNESNPISTTDEDSPTVYFTDGAEFVDPDPGHSFQAMREQIFGSDNTSVRPPPMNGFAQQAESMEPGMSRHVMRGFRPDNLSVYTTLASEFAIFDRWFASVPTSTQPNRLYVHSATSHGLCSNVKKLLIRGFPQKTIFDSLDESGLSFGIYYQNIPATLFFDSLRKIKHVFKFHKFELSFKLHARLGMLPNYVVIEQRYFDRKIFPANDDHPSHDVTEGQKFVKEVYETLRASPQWKEMMFLITYDEHGGFYDHVPTPASNIPSPDDIMGSEPFYFNFDRLGVRVPTLLISPWIEKGTVIHRPNGPTSHSEYEHSSVAATVKKLFNLKSDYLTKRDSWAGSFESYFYVRDKPRTDCPKKLPKPTKSLRPTHTDENKKISEFQEELVLLASMLKGDNLLKGFSEDTSSMTVKEANAYVEDAVTYFLETGKAALMAGANDSTIIQMRPSLTSRKAGPFTFTV